MVELLRGSELSVVAAEQEGGRPYWEADLTGPVALVLGSESSGVPAALLEIATVRVSIPIARPVESLNVAVAAGVLLFEARRQRT